MPPEAPEIVNFTRPIPLFPLSDAVLMPSGVVPLHIFEPRYCQMVSEALDGPGLIALAVFDGDEWREDYEGTPPLRSVVCIGRIVHHQDLEGGRYAIALRGLCRAQISLEMPPEDDRLYRAAMLEPLESELIDEHSLADLRIRLADLYSDPPLTDLREAPAFAQHLRESGVPTSKMVDLVAFVFCKDGEARYRILAEADARRRAELVVEEVESLRRLLRRAAPQRRLEAPKGCNWN